ncbi:MAG: hypothetical protein ACRCWR_00665 [Saezia sp.]
MAKLTIKNSQFDSSKNRFPVFYVFVDELPVGSVSGSTQSLELDITEGKHIVQIRSARVLGRSNRLTIQVKESEHITIHIAEKVAVYATIIISFLALYYILRVHLGLHFLMAAGIGIAGLYAAVALLHPIRITQITV